MTGETGSGGRLGVILAVLACVGTVRGQPVFVNELHYDNAGTDVEEGVEIAGPAGTNLSGFSLLLYNGNGGTVYGTIVLSGTIPDEEGKGFGAIWFGIAGLQNDVDGVALVQNPGGKVIHRLAWEGSFTGSAGAANGVVFPEIAASEAAAPPVGQSLQRTGAGTEGADFGWTGPVAHSRGQLNAGQSFGAVPAAGVLQLLPGLLREGESGTGTLQIIPPPASPATMRLSAEPGGILGLPETVVVQANGLATFGFTALADGVADGFQEAIVLATDSMGGIAAAGAAVQVVDADRPPRTFGSGYRLMSWNVRLGVGAPGSPEFAAVRETLERLSPDVVLLQEVSDAGNFGDVRAVLEQAGFPAGHAWFATTGDSFASAPYSSGDFGTGECLVTASRFPITRTVQIGRGKPGRRELTRFPLYTRIDTPGEDLELVNVHLKAGTTDPDRFRKAVEAYRIREFLAQEGLNPLSHNVLIGGDFNAIDSLFLPPISYNTATWSPPTGTSLPLSWQLGSDLTAAPGITLPYSVQPFNPAASVYPHQGFNPAGLFAPPLRQADGLSSSTFNLFEARFDYWMIPQRLTGAGQTFGEVYNSRLESQADGLPKRPGLPSPALSEVASDHYPVFLDLPPALLPRLQISVNLPEVEESSLNAGLAVNLILNPPPEFPVEVQLGSWRGSRVQFARPVIQLEAGQSTATIPLTVQNSLLAEPERRVSLTASAAGYLPAFAGLTIRSREAGGLLIFSQYIEPSAPAGAPANNASRALEIYNASGSTLPMSRLKWQVRRYTNGATTPVILGSVTAVEPEDNPAELPAGGVLVVGDAALGEALVAGGILPAPAVSIAAASPGTLFCNATGKAIFLKGSNLDFNGDDALELVADGLRCDVFGTIGEDPGSAWKGGPGNPSTADQNLTLRPEIITGSAGFQLPGTRFVATSAGNLTTGLGVPPVPADRFAQWAASAGLTGLAAAPHSDPDGDGRLNLLEFVLDRRPDQADAGDSWWKGNLGSVQTISADPWLSMQWESAATLAGPWAADAGVTGSLQADGLTRWQWGAPSAGAARKFWRLRVARP